MDKSEAFLVKNVLFYWVKQLFLFLYGENRSKAMCSRDFNLKF